MIFDSQIAGIPCQIEITEYVRSVPSNRNCDPADDPYDPGTLEWRVLDRKGYPAVWLEAKMTPADMDRIDSECERELAQDRMGAAYEMAESRMMGAWR